MKKHKKQQFFARKYWLSIFIFVLMMFSGQVFAEECTNYKTPADCDAAIEGSNYCYWDTLECVRSLYDECKTLSAFSCFLEPSCRWDKGGCNYKSSKTKASAATEWSEADCQAMKNEKYKYLVIGEKGENLRDNYTINKEDKKDILINLACIDLVKDGPGHPCDYPSWLTSAGKRKCERYYNLMDKATQQECLEAMERKWETGLKDYGSEITRDKERAECLNVVYMDYYQGPVFDGPGLSGGAQMAQMELSNSISKQRDIKKLLINWSRFAIEIAIVLAVIAIIWAGIRYITDMGDGAGVEAGKKIIMWTVVGLILIMGSYAIVNTIIRADLSPNANINHFIA